MIQYIGHTKAQWELRKSAKPLFQKLWNTEQVKSSKVLWKNSTDEQN